MGDIGSVSNSTTFSGYIKNQAFSFENHMPMHMVFELIFFIHSFILAVRNSQSSGLDVPGPLEKTSSLKRVRYYGAYAFQTRGDLYEPHRGLGGLVLVHRDQGSAAQSSGHSPREHTTRNPKEYTTELPG